MTKSLINDLKRIKSNTLLIKRYTPLLEVSKNNSLSNKVRLLIAKSHYKLFNILYPHRPWTSPASILFFDKVLNNKMVGLEYGSGRRLFILLISSNI